MDSESLHNLSATVMSLGFVLTGLGGAGLYYFSHAAETGMASRDRSPEAGLHARIASLQKENEELRQRLHILENEARQKEPDQVFAEPAGKLTVEPPAKEPVRPSPAARPMPVPVRTAPPPALVEWEGASMLEEMIESSIKAESKDANAPALSEKQLEAITSVLRKHPGGAISIHSVDGDNAGMEFAQALKRAFLEANWKVEGVEPVGYVNPPAGLLITSGKSSSLENTIIPHEALATAGLDVYRGVDTNLKSQKTVLLVGAALK